MQFKCLQDSHKGIVHKMFPMNEMYQHGITNMQMFDLLIIDICEGGFAFVNSYKWHLLLVFNVLPIVIKINTYFIQCPTAKYNAIIITGFRKSLY